MRHAIVSASRWRNEVSPASSQVHKRVATRDTKREKGENRVEKEFNDTERGLSQHVSGNLQRRTIKTERQKEECLLYHDLISKPHPSPYPDPVALN